MSGPGPVDPVGIPVFTGDLALLDTKVTALSGHGAKIAEAAGDVHRSFGGLRAFYRAPEAEQLFATTGPVAAKGQSLSSDLCVIAGALGTYSDDAFPLVERLKELKRDAVAFRVKVDGDDEWSEDGDLVEENRRRRGEIAEVWAAFQEVERACHAKIVALVGGTPLKTGDGSGKPGTYGYDAESLKQAESLPWGEAVEESTPWWQVWEHAYDFGKGFLVDGVWGTLKGLGTLAGFDGGDAAKEAWTGLAKLATGLSPAAQLALHALPGDHSAWLRDSGTAVKETGKALIAWDQWGSNPSRAAGAVTFNVLTTVFTGGTGGAASGAGKAGLAARALSLTSKTARAVDPMTYLFKGAGAGLTRISDAMAGLKGLGRFEVPTIDVDGAIALPEGATHLPDGTVRLPPGTTVPDGATRLPDGTVRLPEGTTAFPPGTVKLPGDGPSQFLDPDGTIYNAAGDTVQHAKDAPTGNPAASTDTPHTDVPKTHSPATAEIPERELAGVGGRNSDDTTRLGSDISDPLHRSDHTPDHTPGGHAPDHIPTNNLDNTPSADRPGGNGPTDHTNTPGTGPTAGHDLPGNPTTGDGPGRPDIPHPRGPGAGSLLGDGPTPPQRQPVPRPSFMHDGPNPYRSDKPLTREQIEEIQVYRANEEPGYRERYYRKDGTRSSLDRHDESGFTPPQLTRFSENDPWIRAKDVPEPPKPHYLDEKYISVAEDTVKSDSRLKKLKEVARKRFEAIQWDNMMEKLKAEAGDNHKALDTDESAALLEKSIEDYKAAHTQMRDAAEDLGEKAAELHYMAEKYPEFEPQPLLGPKNGNDQFDQVWKHKDGRVIVIEAKSSPGTELGRRTLPDGSQVSQGSREYFLDIIEKMRERGEIKTVEALEDALDDGKLTYVVIRGNKNAGTYTGYLYRRFDISKGTLP
ncbi:hypothetical protein ACFV1C_10935 [Streptomyces sp. NPDC059605]|uniref:hypothetical protein n=1 Tax=unclassified Streptomyces TaxID=2593676 RepID=UPI00367436FE